MGQLWSLLLVDHTLTSAAKSSRAVFGAACGAGADRPRRVKGANVWRNCRQRAPRHLGVAKRNFASSARTKIESTMHTMVISSKRAEFLCSSISPVLGA